MTKYLVTIASEVYRTFEIEAELDEEPDAYKWNQAAIVLRDMAFDKLPEQAIRVDSEFIDYLEVEEVSGE
jgi:hypothetical protein